jgi:hypothetical protein
MAKTYVWANDAGHEWLAVGVAEIIRLGITDKISSYSYMRGNTVYLEGDCDASHFFDAKKARGEEVNTRLGKAWDRWPGRSFASYNKLAVFQLHA